MALRHVQQLYLSHGERIYIFRLLQRNRMGGEQSITRFGTNRLRYMLMPNLILSTVNVDH